MQLSYIVETQIFLLKNGVKDFFGSIFRHLRQGERVSSTSEQCLDELVHCACSSGDESRPQYRQNCTRKYFIIKLHLVSNTDNALESVKCLKMIFSPPALEFWFRLIFPGSLSIILATTTMGNALILSEKESHNLATWLTKEDPLRTLEICDYFNLN